MGMSTASVGIPRAWAHFGQGYLMIMSTLCSWVPHGHGHPMGTGTLWAQASHGHIHLVGMGTLWSQTLHGHLVGMGTGTLLTWQVQWVQGSPSGVKLCPFTTFLPW